MHRGRRSIIKEKIIIWESGGGEEEGENQLKLGGIGSTWRQLPTKKKTPTRLDPWEIRDWRLAYWFLNIYNESAFPYFFLSFFISCPLFFLIKVFWFSCLGSLRAPRHALRPTALGDDGVSSGFLFYIRYPFKIHLEQEKFTKKFNSPSILHRKSL